MASEKTRHDTTSLVVVLASLASIAMAAGIVSRSLTYMELTDRRVEQLENEVRLWETYVMDLRTEIRTGLAAGPPPEKLTDE